MNMRVCLSICVWFAAATAAHAHGGSHAPSAPATRVHPAGAAKTAAQHSAANSSANWGPFTEPPERSTLPNGLTVITVPWPSPGIVAYYTLVRVGSRDEVEKGHSGFAHLFEHMMFRGTERFPEQAYEAKIQSLGADNNAYTSQDFTLYTVTAPASALAEVVELEADRFQNLSYTEQVFRTETGAVLGEYNKSASSPFLKMWETLSELAFPSHTYGHTTIGYLPDVQAMPEKFAYSQGFFRRFYTPDNTTIIVAGDVSHADVLAQVKSQYAAWSGKRDKPEVPVEAPLSQGVARHLDWDGSSPPRMFIGYRGPAFCEGQGELSTCLRDAAALEVAHGLLFSASSPLYQRLVVDEQRLLELSSWQSSFTRDPGLFVVDAELKPETSFATVEAAVQGALDELAAGKADAERVKAVRSNLTYKLTLNVETASEAADTLAQFIALTGRPDTLPAYLDALTRVTPEEVARVARTYLNAKRRVVVTLAPKVKADAKDSKKDGSP